MNKKRRKQVEKKIEGLKRQMDILIKKKNIDSEYKVDDNLSHIIIDRDRLIQVLSNLISNAIKYTHENGKIIVNVTKEGDNIKFSLIDTGIGIPKEEYEKIFERFYQIDSSYTRKAGGSGLGLSICKGLVEAMDGKIWVESELDKGTTFSFLLPIKTDVELKKEMHFQLFKSLEEKGLKPSDKEKIDQMIKRGYLTDEGRIIESITPQELEGLGYIKIDYEKIIKIVIEKLEKILGPMAIEAARSIKGIEISKDNKITITGEGKQVLYDLITNYEKFLGPIGKVLANEEIGETLSKLHL